MSLINRMLQDLSTRTPPPGDVLGGVHLGSELSDRPAPRPSGRALLFVSLVAAFAAALVLVLERAQPPLPDPVPLPAVAPPVAAAPLPQLARFQLALALARLPEGPPRRRARSAPAPAEATAAAPVDAVESAPERGDLAAAEVIMPLDPVSTAPQSREDRRRLAREALGRRDAAAAVTLLEPGQPAVEIDPEYHGLLASAYQRLERHAEAARAYEALLRVQPEQAHWWAGLGLSRDALGEGPAALHAYSQARQLGHLEPRVLDHITRRAAALRAG